MNNMKTHHIRAAASLILAFLFALTCSLSLGAFPSTEHALDQTDIIATMYTASSLLGHENPEQHSFRFQSIPDMLASTDVVGFVPFFCSLLQLDAAKSVGGVASNVKYIGRLEDLKNIRRSQTLLDQLPNLGSPKANYYQNMSVLRKSLRDGYTIKDASWFRPNSELAPTLLNPNRTVGQTFLGAERLLLQNRGVTVTP